MLHSGVEFVTRSWVLHSGVEFVSAWRFAVDAPERLTISSMTGSIAEVDAGSDRILVCIERKEFI